MGNLLRCFWQPFALSTEVPAPDGDPVRVRLLGEDLVAFRDNHRYVSKRIEFCSYLQNVEGEVDSSHVSFLHSKFAPDAYADTRSLSLPDYMARDRAPSFYVQATPYGMQIAARRDAEADSY